MEYTLRLHPDVARQIAQWGLSDFLIVEVYLALREDLPSAPMHRLYRDTEGRGSVYAFLRRDPDDARFEHIFMFRVFFDEDETHLNVVKGSYWRNFAPQA
jgi:hypothetical protein